MRVVLVLAATLFLAVGLGLGYIAVIAARRSEGVFLPVAYVAVACLAVTWFIARAALRL